MVGQVLLYAVAGLAIIGMVGLAVGLTSRSPQGRTRGLWILRLGFGGAGALAIVGSFLGGDPQGWWYGLALLVVATGVTAILPRTKS